MYQGEPPTPCHSIVKLIIPVATSQCKIKTSSHTIFSRRRDINGLLSPLTRNSYDAPLPRLDKAPTVRPTVGNRQHTFSTVGPAGLVLLERRRTPGMLLSTPKMGHTTARVVLPTYFGRGGS